MQSWQPHVATQEHQAEALQVPALQQGLPQRGPPGAAHEISQVSSDERMSAELITIFSGASNHLFAMSVAFSSQWRVTGKGMLQSTVETGLWTKMLNEDLHSSLCRNYECPHCHKKFSRSYYLTDHLKVKLSNWNRKINQNISDPLPWKALHLWHLW